MLPTLPLRPATALALLTLTACATTSAPASSDIETLQKAAVDAAVAEFCRGQEPLSLESLPWKDADGRLHIGVTFDEFRAAPEWARTYVVGNDDQWAGVCLK